MEPAGGWRQYHIKIVARALKISEELAADYLDETEAVGIEMDLAMKAIS